MLGPTVEPPVHNPQPEAPGYYQSATGLPLQQLDDSHGRTDMSAASGLALLQNNSYVPDNSISNPASSLHQQPHSSSHGIDPTATQKGRGSRASMHSNNSPVPATATTATYPYQPPVPQANTGLGHRRSASAAQREGMQQNASPRMVAAAQAQARASPAQQMDQTRARSRQGQRTQNRTPVNNGAGIGTVPVAQPRNSAPSLNPLRESTGHNTRHSSHNTGSSGNNDRIPYQPYSQGNSSSQGRDYSNSAAVSLPTMMPSTTTTSYPSGPAANQWSRGSAQQGSDRGYTAANSYNQPATSQSASGLNLRSSGHSMGSANQQQQAQRDYQSFASHQPQQPQASQGSAGAQQNNWLGDNHANGSGSYNSFGQYWP